MDAKERFAQKLRSAMEAAGYEPKPAVLEREFNTRHWGKPMTLHGVRRWLLGETMPDHRKVLTLADWLKVPPEDLAWGETDWSAPLRAAEPQPAWTVGAPYQDRELFDIYRRLPVMQRRLARDVILAIARAHEADEAERSGGRR